MLKKLTFTAFLSLTVLVSFAGSAYSQSNSDIFAGANTIGVNSDSDSANVNDATPTPAGTIVQHIAAVAAAAAAKKDDKPKPIKEVLPDAEKIDGLITLYRKKDRLLAEIKSSNLNTDYLIAIAVAKGAGSSVIGGFTLGGSGDDKLWQFRKIGDKIHVVKRNIKFKANPGTPEELAVDIAYSDNSIYSLPIVATGDSGGDVIDFGSIFMSDLPDLSFSLGSFSRDKSYWGTIKGFQNNIEFRVVATYSGGGSYGRYFRGDSEGTTVTIHYSVSKLPSSGYSTRIADNRIGYFTTSHKNYSKNPNDNHYVRYINRWNLQKADPSAKLSPPKKPIIFWISKTTPYRYRKAVRDGILEWNKAFEKIGFVNAIEVRNQSDNDTWDAEDINYNTFRWITSDAHFAMGPSHVNPITGEILDADIIFDAGFVDSWRSTFNKSIADVIPPETKKMSNNELRNLILKKKNKLNVTKNPNSAETQQERELIAHKDHDDADGRQSHECLFNDACCSYSDYKASQFALASLLFVLPNDDEMLLADNENANSDNAENFDPENINDEDNKKEKNDKKDESKKDDAKKDDDKKEEPKKDDSKKDAKSDKESSDKKSDKKDNKKDDKKKPDRAELQKKLDEAFERFVLEGLKDVVMHEVGHTLGLRHNFKASSWLTLDEINNPKRSKEYGIAGSVMDYLPVNIAPKGKPQGDYFMTTLGPYDYLTIEYGYKVLSGGESEVKDLRAIAAKQAEKGNHYAPDEDVYIHEDPLTIRRDLGSRPIDFARSATDLYYQLLPQVLNRAVKEGESYKDVSGFFLTILSRRIGADYYLARNVGGQYRNRDWRGDPSGRLPIQPVDAKTQRESVEFLCKTLLAPGSLSIPPELYNRFGEEIWLNNGSININGGVYSDIRELFLDARGEILITIIEPNTLARINDLQFRVGAKDDIYSVEEHFETLTKTIFKDLDSIGEGTFTNKKPAIDIQQRDLQSVYVRVLSILTLREQEIAGGVPNARAITKSHLVTISKKIEKVLSDEAKLDAGSKIYLEDLKSRIDKTLNSIVTQSYVR